MYIWTNTCPCKKTGSFSVRLVTEYSTVSDCTGFTREFTFKPSRTTFVNCVANDSRRGQSWKTTSTRTRVPDLTSVTHVAKRSCRNTRTRRISRPIRNGTDLTRV
uniref:Uncharacterized protein n=1 Tax=Cacopsylla melanoneura TaxID=428564 RepID=A0A8D8Q335_9HEMI